MKLYQSLATGIEKKYLVGICNADGEGLDCEEVMTYCTAPGDHGECGSSRNCYDAGLCGLGSGSGWDGDGFDNYPGVCGVATHGGPHGGLDCDEVATYCAWT